MLPNFPESNTLSNWVDSKLCCSRELIVASCKQIFHCFIAIDNLLEKPFFWFVVMDFDVNKLMEENLMNGENSDGGNVNEMSIVSSKKGFPLPPSIEENKNKSSIILASIISAIK